MDVGLQLIFSSYGWDEGLSDGQVYKEELGLALLAEERGGNACYTETIYDAASGQNTLEPIDNT